MRVPFDIDGTGGVAYTEDPVQIASQHLLSALGTTPGERVMRPTYGSTVQSYAFDLADDAMAAMLEVELQTAAAMVDDAAVTSVQATPSSSDGLVQVAVQFQTAQGADQLVLLTQEDISG